MMRAIKNWQVDLFAVPITLNHEGRDKAKSRHGVFLTLLFVGFIIWFVYSVSKQMFTKENPNTITYDGFQQIPSPLELNKDTFPFAVGVQLPSEYSMAYFMDEEIYHPVIKQLVFRVIKNDDGTITKDRQIIDVDIEPCRYEHFGDSWQSVKDLPLSSLYCINPVQSKLDKIEVAGIEDVTTYKAFYIGIQMCYNTTDITCKPDAEMNAKLSRSWFNIMYLQSSINPQNYTHPNQRFLRSFTTMMSPTMLKSAIIELSHLNVIDDDGWLFESKHTNEYIKVNIPTEYFDLQADPDLFLWSGVFQISQVVTTYERTYTRLQTVLAQIQGSAATVILALVVILHPYSQIKFRETLINELFDVKLKKAETAGNSAVTVTNNGTKILKKKKSIDGGLRLQKQGSKNQEKERAKSKSPSSPRSPRSPKSPGGGIRAIEIKLSKIVSKEARERNGASCQATDRELMLVKQEERSLGLEKGLTIENKLIKLNSFKTLLNSIDNTNASPEVSYHRSPQTLDKNFLLDHTKGGQDSSPESCRKSSSKGFSLAIEKPEQIKLPALVNRVSDGPTSPCKITDASVREEKVEERKPESGSDSDSAAGGENNKRDFLQLPSPAMSPKTGTERQGFISLDMVDLKANEGVEEVTQDEDAVNFESSKIDISIWEFLVSFVKKNDRTKEKFDVLDKGMKNVRERMDILNIMKKFRELDKLKTLLLEEDQLILFNAIPKAEIRAGENETDEMLKSKSFSQRILKKSTFIELHEKQEQLRKSFDNINMKEKKSKIDYRLLEFYHQMLSSSSPLGVSNTGR